MNMQRTAVFLILMSFVGVSLAASDVYMEKDEQGVTVFSDVPKKTSKKIELAPLPTYNAPASTGWKYQPPAKKAEASGAYQYDELSILAPLSDERILSNHSLVPVQIGLDPPLQASLGHQLEIYLNDALVITTQQLEAFLPNMNPGAYQLSVRLVDSAGTILKAASVSFNKVADARVRDLDIQEQSNSQIPTSPPVIFAPTLPKAPQAEKYPSPNPTQSEPPPIRLPQ